MQADEIRFVHADLAIATAIHCSRQTTAAGSSLGMSAHGTVAAAPSAPRRLTYHFTDCSGPAGTPATIDAVKQPGEAAALHLVDGGGA